jgi:hypothetical protein
MASELFNPDDFRSIRIDIKGKNLTSGVVIKEEIRIEMLELEEDKLVLSMAVRSCAAGHQLELDLQVRAKGLEERQKVTAKVVDVEKCDRESERVRLLLIQYDRAGWIRWTGLVSGRQGEIEGYFKQVKETE